MGTKLRSISQRISSLGEESFALISDLFTDHMGKRRRVVDAGGGRFEPRDFVAASDEIGKERQQKLSKLLDTIDILADSAGMDRHVRERTQACRRLYADGMPFLGAFKSHISQFKKWLEMVVDVAAKLPDRTAGDVLLIVDTNSLIHFPTIESWSFAGISRFVLVLPSTTLGELDSFATSNKSEAVKETSRKLVRQIKGYRDRCRDSGTSILDGAVIVRDRIQLRIDPREPVFPETLNWLNQNSNDDKLIARAIGLMREHPQCAVAIITRDMNLQSKAELAAVEFLEPPDRP